jgi:hypothetical protein
MDWEYQKHGLEVQERDNSQGPCNINLLIDITLFVVQSNTTPSPGAAYIV